MIYFTSDTHFDHEIMMSKGVGLHYRMLFKSVDRMNNDIIKRWNEKVKEDDIVYHLGDFSGGKLSQVREKLSKLNGSIRIVPGNHDQWMEELKKNLMMGKNPITKNGSEATILPPIYELVISKDDRYEHGFPKKQYHDSMFDIHLVLCHYPL